MNIIGLSLGDVLVKMEGSNHEGVERMVVNNEEESLSWPRIISTTTVCLWQIRLKEKEEKREKKKSSKGTRQPTGVAVINHRLPPLLLLLVSTLEHARTQHPGFRAFLPTRYNGAAWAGRQVLLGNRNVSGRY